VTSRSSASPLSRRLFIDRFSTGASALALALALATRTRGETPAPTRPLGIVLAGLGNYATRELLPALKETKFCRLAGVVTGSAEKGRTWAKEHGFPEKNVWNYHEMQAMESARDVDVVYVVTPNSLHAEHSIRAARAGKHVICEKPMAVSVAECDAMIAACEKAGRTLTMGYRLHFDPYHQELIRLARTQAYGPFMKMSGGFGFHMARKVWRAERALAGGGPMMDLGIYAVHEACLAAQANPIAVTGKERPKTRPEFFTDVEESLDWTMEFPNGARAELFTSYNESMNRFRAEAARGWIEIGPAFGYRGLKAATSEGPLNFPPLRQQAAHLDAISRANLEKTELPTPASLGRRDMVVIEGIYEAARTGRRVTLTW